MFIGRKFCGYICPIGTLQEVLFSLRSKKYRRLKRVPFFYEYKFRKLIYIIMGLTVVLVLIGKSPLYMLFCPVQTIGIIPNIFITGILIWLIIIIGSLFTERFWCRYLCPMAALMNLFQMLSKLFGFKRLMIKRNLEKCVDCCNCIKNCPMNIDLQQSEYIIDLNCIHCMKCAASCPKPNTINEEVTKRDCYE
jgi:polyferredoxin